jgi:DNA-binding MarR family transcriptional regulator
MTESLSRRLKQARFSSPQQEAVLSLAVASGALNSMIDTVCERYGITRPQYNVLRILRGVHPEGHPRCEIAVRMIDRAPDITRLVDRLQTQGLVRRSRSGHDQRQAITRITPKGLKLMETMNPDLESSTNHLLAKLGEKECHDLSRLCALIFESADDLPPKPTIAGR